MNARILYCLVFILVFTVPNLSNAQLIMRVDSSLNSKTNNLATADVNGDGLQDIVGYLASSNIVWYKNLGDSIEKIPTTFFLGEALSILRTADMDNDGDIDFVICSYYDKLISWIENADGTGTLFYQHYISGAWYGSGPRSLDLCDINNDGYIDIVSNMGTDNLILFKNNGLPDPLFAQQLIEIGTSDPYYIRTQDLDIDEDLDIIYYSKTLNQVIFRENTGAGTFESPGVVLLGIDRVISLKFSDLDLDNDADMLLGFDYIAGSSAIKLYENYAGAFTLKHSWDYPYDVIGISTANFNGDSLPDIYTLFNETGLGYDEIALNEVAVFINDDSLTFKPEIIPLEGIIPDAYNNSVSSVTIGDFDLNGIEDLILADYNMLLVASSSDTSEQIFSKYQEVFKPRSTVFTIAQIQMADSAAYNALLIDRHLDIYQYRINADTAEYIRTIEQAGINNYYSSSPYSSIIFDIDNDGFKDDIFTSGGMLFDEGYDGIFEWNTYKNATNNTLENVRQKPEYSCKNPVLGDINGDGYLDIIAANGQLFYEGVDYDGFDIYDEYFAYFWLKNLGGSGNFEYMPLPEGFYDDEGYPEISDVDLDGDLDIIVYSPNNDFLFCYYNIDGTGIFSEKTTIINIPNGKYFLPFDVDGDSIQDIVISGLSGQINWLKHTGPDTYAAPVTICYEAVIGLPDRMKLGDINNDGFDDLIVASSQIHVYLNTGGHSLYPFPILLPFNYNNLNVTDLNQNGINEIAGSLNTTLGYAREIDPTPAIPDMQFSNFGLTVDENQSIADTLKIALTEIPNDTIIITIYPTEIDGNELEVQLNDAATDTIQLLFLPDSSALETQQVLIYAINDAEVDAIENGRITYTIDNHEGNYELQGTLTRNYQIIDNDNPLPDAGSNYTVNCNDTILYEGTFGAACNINLNIPIHYPVNFTVITDNQLDVGSGPQDSIVINMLPTDYSKTFYVDAVTDNIEENVHTGVLIFKVGSEDDNFDFLPTATQLFTVQDSTYNGPDNPIEEETQSLQVLYTANTQDITIQFNLHENDAMLSLLNNLGEIIFQFALSSSSGATTISASHLPEGYYYIMINSINNHFSIGKPVVIY